MGRFRWEGHNFQPSQVVVVVVVVIVVVVVVVVVVVMETKLLFFYIYDGNTIFNALHMLSVSCNALIKLIW